MRMIDGDELYNIEKLLDTNIVQKSKEAAWLMSQVLHDIEAMPSIDPETLPIVQKLRAKNFMLQTNIESLEKQLAKVTAERDVLKSNPSVEIKSDAFELAMKLAQVTTERNRALFDIPKNCFTCSQKNNLDCKGDKRYRAFGFCENCEHWEWRGKQEGKDNE